MKKKVTQSSSTLKVLNDIYLIEEDEMEHEYDLSGEVEEAVRSGKLHIPDAFEDYSKKVPDKGVLIAQGPDVKYKLALGTRVLYGRFAGSRFKYDGKNLVRVREYDVHAVIN